VQTDSSISFPLDVNGGRRPAWCEALSFPHEERGDERDDGERQRGGILQAQDRGLALGKRLHTACNGDRCSAVPLALLAC
jgi:hypothetical protein